jgi:hypothetical protein
MRILFILLAFLACGYIWLGCIGEAMSYMPPSGWTPLRFLAISISACCALAIWKIKWAVIASWIAVLIFLAFGWRLYAAWAFRDCAIRFTFWAPAFLTIAALLPSHDEQESS